MHQHILQGKFANGSDASTGEQFCHTLIAHDGQFLATFFDISPNLTTLQPNFCTFIDNNFETYRQDFLWNAPCFECFFSMNNEANSPYLEVNFSPIGYFNIYHFDSYRNPNHIPPRQLNNITFNIQQDINFFNGLNQQFWQKCPADMYCFLENLTNLSEKKHLLIMCVRLSAISHTLVNDNFNKTLFINPCLVAQTSHQLSYWATQHAQPPDFHDKTHWLKIA